MLILTSRLEIKIFTTTFSFDSLILRNAIQRHLAVAAENHEDHDHEEEGHHYTGHHRTTTGHQHTAHLRMDHMVDLHHRFHQTEGLLSQNFEQYFSKNYKQGTDMSLQAVRCISLILMNILTSV